MVQGRALKTNKVSAVVPGIGEFIGGADGVRTRDLLDAITESDPTKNDNK